MNDLVYFCSVPKLINMNRKPFLMMMILAGLSLVCSSARANEPIQSIIRESHEIPIRTHDEGSFPPGTPRTPSIIPISCYFDDVAGYLCFSFLFPMGDVTITLTEAIAGVVSTDEYSTSSCSVVVLVPSQGTYEVSIVLESGTEYEGQFIY